MDETTKKEFKEILQTELEIQFKKELGPVHAKLERLDGIEGKINILDGKVSSLTSSMKKVKDKLNDLSIKADSTAILVSNLAVDMVDVPDNIKEILRRQRHTETHIDWLAKYHKDEEADENVNFRLIEKHKQAILMVAERSDAYKAVKEVLES